MSVQEYTIKKFGKKLYWKPKTVTVQTTPTQILDYNPNRFSLIIINLSSNHGFINWEAEVSATNGMLVSANGGSIHMLVDEDGDAVTLPIYAINLNASGIWKIFELVS